MRPSSDGPAGAPNTRRRVIWASLGLVAVGALACAVLLERDARAIAAKLISAAEHREQIDKRVLTDAGLKLDGQTIPVAGAGAGVTGAVTMRVAPDGLTFDGWAADIKARTPVRKVVIVVNDIYVDAALANLPSPEAGSRFGPELAQAGFTLSIPITMSGAASRSVRFFAISQTGEAIAIPLTREARDLLQSRHPPERTDG